MMRCGYLLRDKFLINKAKKYVDFVLKHADSDGYLGPKFLKSYSYCNRWSHSIFFRAMMAHYSATGDKRVLSALTKHYLSNTTPHAEERNICNVENILWVYGKTGNKRLLDCAINAYDKYNLLEHKNETTLKNMLSGKRPTIHGVTYNETAKLGAIFYMYTGKKKYLDATVNAYRKIDKYQMLIDGICSSSEFLKGKDPLDSHETCDIADYTWSAGYLLLATGNVEYADKIERACFNAAPGAVRSDFKALQYFSCPNQVIADYQSNHNYFLRGRNWMSYRPITEVECCTGEVNRIMPNFASRMWLKDKNNNLAAVLYAPSRISTGVGKKQQKVTVIEETNYPFSDSINFIIRTSGPVSFTLKLRIPAWCSDAQVYINNQPVKIKAQAGKYVKINRKYSDNDRVALILPMQIKISHWPRGGIGIERGPLVYALPVKENRNIGKKEKRANKNFPAWNLYPAGPWNYAFISKNLIKNTEIIRQPFCIEPWSVNTTPVKLRVPARLVSGWKVTRKKSIACQLYGDNGLEERIFKGNYSFTPQLPDSKTLKKRLSKKIEMVELVPYGCAKLRIAIFPKSNQF
jgi:DUF1680 family protein